MRKKTHKSHPVARINTVHIPSESPKNESAYQFTAKETAYQKESQQIKPEMSIEFAAIRKDLTVTVVLAAIAICAEYILALQMK